MSSYLQGVIKSACESGELRIELVELTIRNLFTQFDLGQLPQDFQSLPNGVGMF